MNWMDDHFEFGVDSFENLTVDPARVFNMLRGHAPGSGEGAGA